MREHVDVIIAPKHVSFSESISALYDALKAWLASRNLDAQSLIWTRVYMSDPANQVSLLKESALFGEILSQSAFSYIGQPLLNGSKLALLFGVNLDGKVTKEGDCSQMIVSEGNTRQFFHSVRLTEEEAEGLNPTEQTQLIFNRHIAWLKENGMTLKDNCIRTWLYVRDIDHNYAAVMKGRNSIFDAEGLTPDTHFIASTGIGGYTESSKATIAIDFFSVDQQPLAPKYLNALEYLNPTHEYGVAFERGAKVDINGDAKVFISGTASIDKHGNCLYIGDVEKQSDRLFLNISKLLEDAGRKLTDMTYMVVYLRDIADAHTIEAYMEKHYPGVPRLVVEASVCRPHWLVEVECMTR